MMYLVVLFLLVSAWLPSIVAAKEAVTFSMVLSDDEEDIQVIVKAQQASDVYAYDMNVEYDALRLKLKAVKSEMTGFTVEPIVKGNHIRIAHTKVGSSPGVTGDVRLAALTFERIRGGDATITLTEVQLVDSDIKTEVFEPNSQVTAADHTGLIPFTDIAGHWAETSIHEAMELGLTTGYEDGTFRPQGSVTRAEFVTMLVRALMLPVETDVELAFADYDNIPEWARPYVAAATDAKIARWL